jgi:hypothetical protein
MPPIGLRESQYMLRVQQADNEGDRLAHEANKVGQYITLALQPRRRWSEKLRFFKHALDRHCTPPDVATEAMRVFYQDLVSLIRDHCGAEALRLASREDDIYVRRVARGDSRELIADEAALFFVGLIGHDAHCPSHFHPDDWEALQVFRNQWV